MSEAASPDGHCVKSEKGLRWRKARFREQVALGEDRMKALTFAGVALAALLAGVSLASAKT
ncbi:MAG: hypothetical protein WA397_05560, partial [Roseiarcus sp.]